MNWQPVPSRSSNVTSGGNRTSVNALLVSATANSSSWDIERWAGWSVAVIRGLLLGKSEAGAPRCQASHQIILPRYAREMRVACIYSEISAKTSKLQYRRQVSPRSIASIPSASARFVFSVALELMTTTATLVSRAADGAFSDSTQSSPTARLSFHRMGQGSVRQPSHEPRPRRHEPEVRHIRQRPADRRDHAGFAGIGWDDREWGN